MARDHIPEVVSARHVGGHVVHLRFDDGVEGDVDIRQIAAPLVGILEPLADPAFVARVSINDSGTITWPGDLDLDLDPIDLDPIVLYCAVKGISISSYLGKPPNRRRTAPSRSSKKERGRAWDANLLHDIVSAHYVGGHVMHLRFDDGVEGDVDIRDVVGSFSGRLAPLADPAFVARGALSAFGTIRWPGGLLLDLVVLYCAVKGIPVPDFDDPDDRRPASGARGRRAASRTTTSTNPARKARRRGSSGRRTS